LENLTLRPHLSINCKGKLLSLAEPKVMAIINVTPDSFYSSSRAQIIEDTLRLAEKHISEGADILDIGGYSSRPGAAEVNEKDELNRVVPVIERILKEFPETIISIDTFRSTIAHNSLRAGAAIINDISAGELDDQMFALVINENVPYIMMHMQGTPQTMQLEPQYNDVTMDIIHYFSGKINFLHKNGVTDLLIDVGFGFGKTLAHNYQLLRELNQFRLFNLPILTGISRKSMIYKPLQSSAENALNATTAAHMIALMNGSNILRVHDVKAAKEAISIYKMCYPQS
jgi:dihydropteroate synthase